MGLNREIKKARFESAREAFSTFHNMYAGERRGVRSVVFVETLK